MMMMMMRVQKVALKSLKIEYVVALGISLDILVQQMREKKSYGFRAIWSQIFFRTKIQSIWSSAHESHQKSFKILYIKVDTLYLSHVVHGLARQISCGCKSSVTLGVGRANFKTTL